MLSTIISQDQVKLLELSKNISIVIVLIGIYWFVLDKFRKSLRNLFPRNLRIRLLTDIIFTLLTVLISFLTLSIAFANNFGAFLGGLGLVSTALVFALQDFVASFFGWLHVRVNHLYGVNHEITVHINNAKYTGKVSKIGILRTTIKVRLGDDSLDTEQMTGRTVSFPNHLVLKDAVDNFTTNNQTVWHRLPIIITFESDINLAKTILARIAEKQYNYTLDHNQELLDKIPNSKSIYKPKIYLDIDTFGPKYTIWFACNIGYYREIVNRYSSDILDEFNKNNIHFAYPTQRHLVENNDTDRNFKIEITPQNQPSSTNQQSLV